MATVGPYFSTQYTALYNTLPVGVGVHRNERGRKRTENFTYTQVATGTDGDLVNLCKVPGGARILLPELLINFSDWTASTVLSLGWAAYTQPDGVAVAADPDGLINDLDISQGGVGIFMAMMALVGTTSTLTIDPPLKFDHAFNARHPVDITATISGAAPVAAGYFNGYVTFVG